MTVREPYDRLDAWLREHTAAAFLLYLLASGLTFAGFQLLLSDRPLSLSLALGLVFGVAVATVLTFVEFP